MINEPFRPVRGIGVAASVLIGLTAVHAVADAIVTQNFTDVVQDQINGTGTMDDLDAANALNLMVSVLGTLVSIAAGVTFIVWIYRSRRNAERVTYDTEHRHSRGWAIGSWVTPIVALWYPLQIVQDVWRSFDPAQQDRPLQARDKNGFLVAWWIAFLLMSVGDRGVARVVLYGADRATVVTWTWVATVVTIVAAALAVVLIKRLTDLQDVTRPQEFSGPVQVHVPGA